MEVQVADCVNLARQLFEEGTYSRSFDTYLMAFEASPEFKPLLELEFRSVLTKLSDFLSAIGKVDVIFENYGHALKAFPENAYIINELGKFLFKYGFYLEAWGHFQKSLMYDYGFVDAEKNLNSVKNLLVERWHFRMLNDQIRNKAYQQALSNSIIPFKDSVLDIGTGTGLLTMYACENSPVIVTACDGNETMAKLAEEILDENEVFLVLVINKMSTSLLPKDIGGFKSLVVTELFDAGLFGEHVLPALDHAWENLVNKKNRVIPNGAEFYVTGVKCDSLNKRYQLCKLSKEMLTISHLNVHSLAHDESYDSDDVHSYKDLKYITDSQKLLDIDFCNPNDIKNKMFCSDPFNVSLNCIDDGELNVFIGWFNLNLTADVRLTTNPTSENRATAWQQAIFFDSIPQNVEKGDIVNASFIIHEDKLTMQCSHNGQVIRASPEIIRFLNDTEMMNIVFNLMPLICEHLSGLGDTIDMDILDLCPFPIMGLYLLKREFRSLVCCVKNDYDKIFIEKVFQCNKIPLSKLTILTEYNEETFYDEKYHAIFCNILDLCGDIDIRQKQLAENLKLENLVEGGLFFPSKVTLVGQLVRSDWLDLNNRVYDENVSGYNVAKFVNEYQVSQNFGLDYNRLEFDPMSDAHELGNCMSDLIPEVFNIPVTQSGDCNAVLCWYKIELWKNHEIETNRTNAFMDCMAFLANPKVTMQEGNNGNILCCVDPDGSFKLLIDVDI